jgi:hypothetical protein
MATDMTDPQVGHQSTMATSGTFESTASSMTDQPQLPQLMGAVSGSQNMLTGTPLQETHPYDPNLVKFGNHWVPKGSNSVCVEPRVVQAWFDAWLKSKSMTNQSISMEIEYQFLQWFNQQSREVIQQFGEAPPILGSEWGQL